MLFVIVHSAYKQLQERLSPLDKFEFLAKEADVADYAFDEKGHYAYLRGGYLYVKKLHADTKELKSLINVKIGEQLDRLISMRSFVAFSSSDLQLNQVIELDAKFAKNKNKTFDFPQFSSTLLQYSRCNKTHLLIFESLFVLSYGASKTVYRENVLFHFFFKNSVIF